MFEWLSTPVEMEIKSTFTFLEVIERDTVEKYFKWVISVDFVS